MTTSGVTISLLSERDAAARRLAELVAQAAVFDAAFEVAQARYKAVHAQYPLFERTGGQSVKVATAKDEADGAAQARYNAARIARAAADEYYRRYGKAEL